MRKALLGTALTALTIIGFSATAALAAGNSHEVKPPRIVTLSDGIENGGDTITVNYGQGIEFQLPELRPCKHSWSPVFPEASSGANWQRWDSYPTVNKIRRHSFLLRRVKPGTENVVFRETTNGQTCRTADETVTFKVVVREPSKSFWQLLKFLGPDTAYWQFN